MGNVVETIQERLHETQHISGSTIGSNCGIVTPFWVTKNQ
jgi:hypothetical protein